MSIIVNHQKKFIMCHVPKTGGTMIKEILINKFGLSGWIGGHKPIYQIDNWKEYYSFSFVRNPYTRIQSAYRHLYSTNEYKKSFDEFCKNPPNHILVKPQHYFLNRNNEILVSKIGRYENIENDFREILNKIELDDKIKIPHIRKGDISIKTILNTENKENIYKKYKKDFELFGYKK